tara:strand:- start:1121 stop:1873 length:753 start_codon:yes stop_codon:yes gene_type:complete
MKNIIALLFTISFFVANSQDVDEIINNYIEITGGVEAYQELEGYKIYASVNQQGLEIPIEIVQSKNRTSLKLTLQGQELKQGVFDGEVLWSVGFPDFKPVKSDDEDVANLKNELKSFPDPFLKYKELGYTVELEGTEDFEGTEVYLIKLTKTPVLIDGEEFPNIDYWLFDTENNIPLAVRSEILEGQGKGFIEEQRFSDYQEVEGIYFPFSLTFGIKDQPGGQTFVVQKMEINPEIDDSEFKFPEEEIKE